MCEGVVKMKAHTHYTHIQSIQNNEV